MKSVIKILFFALIAIIIYSCAQQVSPSGGQKDSAPPQIKKSIPENFSVNFSGTELELKFDEFVQLKNINQQLIISPSVEGDPEPKIKGKKVSLNLGEALKTNTTYQINFGDGIADWNEGNVLDSNLFVFSTGNYIDSLSVSGNVKDAFTHSPSEGVLIMLYENGYDSIPFKEIPTYFSKTDKTGAFELNYLKSGVYKVFGLKDFNDNYLYDNFEELIAFQDDIVIPMLSNEIELALFQEKQVRNQYVESAKLLGQGRIRIILNEPIIDFHANALNAQFKKDWNITDVFLNKDTVDLWLTGTEGLDTLSLEIIDSIPLDTFYIATLFEERDSLLTAKFNIAKQGKLAPFNKLKIKFSEPLLDSSADSITMFRLSDSTFIDLNIAAVSANLREIELAFDKKSGESYELTVLPGEFNSIFGNTNDTIVRNISIADVNNFASLSMNIVLDSLIEKSEFYFVQLLNNNKTVVAQHPLTKTSTILFNNLSEGDYTVILVSDKNNNRQWDTGNYLKQVVPEKVIVYSDVITIQGGWDQEIFWVLKD